MYQQLILGYIPENPVRGDIYTNGFETVPENYSWGELINHDKTRSVKYENIYILDEKLFKTKGDKNLHKRFHSFISRVIDHGCIFIKDDILYEFRIPKHFKYIDTIHIDICNVTFLVRKYVKNDGNTIELNQSQCKKENILIPKPRKKVREYVMLETVQRFENLVCDDITFDVFKELLYDEEFISDFHLNLNRLFDYKIEKYEFMINDFEKKNELNKIKIDDVKKVYCDNNKKIDDIFSEHLSNSLILVHLKSIISRLKKLKNTFSLESLRISLRYSFLDSEDGLESLIGMDDIKNTICELFYGFSKNYNIFTDNFINFCITGNPGSGKTYLSERIGRVFLQNKIFINDIKKLSRADLVGMYVGHTSKEVKNLLYNSIEGVIIIDEAYSLVPKSDRDFSSETISEIVNFMDKYICCECIIFLGYHDKMSKEFLTYNEGMKRRIPYLYHCNDYTCQDLTYSCVIKLEKKLGYNLGEYLENLIYTYITMYVDLFPNQMGDILNLSQIIFSKMLIFGINEDAILKAFIKFKKNDIF